MNMPILTLGPSYVGKQYSCLQVELKSINPTRLGFSWSASQASKPWFRTVQLVCPGAAASSSVQIHPSTDAWESLAHVLPQNAYYQSLARYEYMDPVLHLNEGLTHLESWLAWITAQTHRQAHLCYYTSYRLLWAPSTLDYPGYPIPLLQQITG